MKIFDSADILINIEQVDFLISGSILFNWFWFSKQNVTREINILIAEFCLKPKQKLKAIMMNVKKILCIKWLEAILSFFLKKKNSF